MSDDTDTPSYNALPEIRRTDEPRRELTLSAEAQAALKLPLTASDFGSIKNGNGALVAIVSWKSHGFKKADEIAAFIADALNELLTPATPIQLDPISNTELRQSIDWTYDEALRREG